MTIDTKWWFDNNKDFRNYVEKYIFKHHITLEEALRHAAVLEYALYLKNKENENDIKNEQWPCSNPGERHGQYGEDRSC